MWLHYLKLKFKTTDTNPNVITLVNTQVLHFSH